MEQYVFTIILLSQLCLYKVKKKKRSVFVSWFFLFKKQKKERNPCTPVLWTVKRLKFTKVNLKLKFNLKCVKVKVH